MTSTYRYLTECQLPGGRASLVQPSNIGLEEVSRDGDTRQSACASALPGIGGEVADCRLRARKLAPDHPLLLDPSDHEYPGRLLRPGSSDIDDQEMRAIRLI
jgi:hypothetical protein